MEEQSSNCNIFERLRGKLSGLLVCVVLTVVYGLVKISELPAAVVFLLRCFFSSFLFVGLAIVLVGISSCQSQVRTNWKVLGIRSVCDSIALCLFYICVEYFPLTKLAFLGQTQSFFVMAASWIILREKLNIFQVVCLVTAFIGAMLVIQPPFLPFPDQHEPESNHTLVGEDESDAREYGNVYVGAAILVLGLTLFSVGSTLMRKMSSSNQLNWAVVASCQAVCGLVLSFILVLILGKFENLVDFVMSPSLKESVITAGLAVLSVLLQLGIFYCTKYEKTAMLPLLCTPQVLLMPLSEFLVEGHLPWLNVFHCIGFFLTITAILVILTAALCRDRLRECFDRNENEKGSLRDGQGPATMPSPDIKAVNENGNSTSNV